MDVGQGKIFVITFSKKYKDSGRKYCSRHDQVILFSASSKFDANSKTDVSFQPNI